MDVQINGKKQVSSSSSTLPLYQPDICSYSVSSECTGSGRLTATDVVVREYSLCCSLSPSACLCCFICAGLAAANILLIQKVLFSYRWTLIIVVNSF